MVYWEKVRQHWVEKIALLSPSAKEYSIKSWMWGDKENLVSGNESILKIEGKLAYYEKVYLHDESNTFDDDFEVHSLFFNQIFLAFVQPKSVQASLWNCPYRADTQFDWVRVCNLELILEHGKRYEQFQFLAIASTKVLCDVLLRNFEAKLEAIYLSKNWTTAIGDTFKVYQKVRRERRVHHGFLASRKTCDLIVHLPAESKNILFTQVIEP